MDHGEPARENHLWGPDWPTVRDQWLLDPSVAFLNHGSFGACPRPVLEAQAELRERMERQPVEFLWRRLPGLIANVRETVAAFLRVDPAGLAFVPNATTGIETVLAGIPLEAGDELLITDHSYPAVRNSAHRTCAARGASLRVQAVPLPLPPAPEVAGIILAGLGPRTKLVILEHVTSPTAATFPVAAVIEGCRENGVPILVDAAHVPGMVEVDLEALRPDFWTGNFHKWACAPKGSAVLYVSEPWRARIHPLVTSHGYGGSFHAEFDWTGTADPTPYLTIPAALDFMASLGWDRVRSHNHALAGYGRTILAAALGTEPQVPEDAFGSMAVVALPPGSGASREDAMAIQARLYEAARVEVPMTCWNDRGYVRLSAQAYNAPSEFERLASALPMAIHPAAAG